MGGVKRMMEEVAERMGIDDFNDPRVKTEVNRQLSINHRRQGSMYDLDYAIQTEADQICDKRYGREFGDLPNKIQYDVWREAEDIVRGKLADKAEMEGDERRLRGNGHGLTHLELS